LAFYEVVEERFDLIVLKDDYFAKPVQALLGVVSSNELKARALELGGYDLRETGTVVFPV
jgi:putative molybdopterin biosynthesis protein